MCRNTLPVAGDIRPNLLMSMGFANTSMITTDSTTLREWLGGFW